jgi:hypothetical protein
MTESQHDIDKNPTLDELREINRQREDVRNSEIIETDNIAETAVGIEAEGRDIERRSLISELSEVVSDSSDSLDISEKIDTLDKMEKGEVPDSPEVIEDILYFLDDYEVALRQPRSEQAVREVRLEDLRAKVEEARRKIERVLEKDNQVAGETEGYSRESTESLAKVQEFLGGDHEMTAVDFVDSKESLEKTRKTLVQKLEQRYGGVEAPDQITRDSDTKELLAAIDEAEAALDSLYDNYHNGPSLDEQRIPEWRESLIKWRAEIELKKEAGEGIQVPTGEDEEGVEVTEPDHAEEDTRDEIDKILDHEYRGFIGDYRPWAEKIAEDRATSEVREMYDRRDNERGLWGVVRFGARRASLRFFAEARRQRLKYQYIEEIREGVESGDNETVQRLQAAMETQLIETTNEIMPSGESSAGEELNGMVKDLVLSYARGEIDSEEFEVRRQSIVDSASSGNREVFLNNEFRTDNLFELAERLKAIADHDGALERFDSEFAVSIGNIKSTLKTEAQRSAVDRTIMWMQRTPVLNLITPESAAVVLAVVYSSSNEAARMISRSKLAAVSTFGATGLMAFAYGAVRRKTELDTDRQLHFVEMATGGVIGEGSRRRERMEQFRVETMSATSRTERINELTSRDLLSESETRELTELVAESTARIRLSDSERTDLIGYTSYENSDTERRDLYLANARGRATLRDIAERDGSSLDDLLDVRTESFRADLASEVEESSRDYSRDRLRQVIISGGIAAGSALLIMGATSLGREFVSNLEFDDGISERVLGPISAIRRMISGEREMIDSGSYNVEKIGEYATLRVPEGIDLVKNPDGTFDLFNTVDNEVIANHITIGSDGAIGVESREVLSGLGITLEETQRQISETITETKEVTAQDIIEGRAGSLSEKFERVYRTLWYDNDTPRKFDLNELKLWWGGDGNTGLTENGDYVMDISHMTRGGSFHGSKSADFLQELKDGNLRLNFSLTQGTQRHVFSLPFDESGKAVIPHDSEIGDMLFDTVNGKAVFQGRFAEVAQVVGQRDGHDVVRMLATYEGSGVNGGTIETAREVFHNFVDNALEIPRSWDYSIPPFIPVWGRRPLESLEQKTLTDSTNVYYGYGAEGLGLLGHEEYVNRADRRLINNPDLDLSVDDLSYVEAYLQRQDSEYVNELTEMVEGAIEPNNNAKVVITIPAYMEGKNGSLEKTLEALTKVKGRSNFEVVIFENHTAGQERDNTGSIIEKYRQQHPDLHVTHLYHAFTEKPSIGEVRKVMVDAVMLRKQKARIEQSQIIVSQDADLIDINSDYVDILIERFERESTLDAIAGKWDFPMETYEKMPILHASQRLWQYFDIAFRNYHLNAPELIGRNSAFRSGVYASIGGYNPEARVAEDLEIGWMVKHARRYDSKRVKYVNPASLVSNPRRAVAVLAQGGKLPEQYGDFHENEVVRNISLDELLEQNNDMTLQQLAMQVQAIYEFYQRFKRSKGGWMGPEEGKTIDKAFERAMRFLGVAYIIQNDRVVITNIEKLVEGVERRFGKNLEVIDNPTSSQNPSEGSQLPGTTEEQAGDAELASSSQPEYIQEIRPEEQLRQVDIEEDLYPTLEEAFNETGIRVGTEVMFSGIAGPRKIVEIDFRRGLLTIDPPIPNIVGDEVKTTINIENVLRRKAYAGNKIIQDYLNRPSEVIE